MKIKTITATRGATINLGNYENRRIEFGVTADVEDDETPEDAMDDLIVWIRARLKREVKEVRESMTKVSPPGTSI
ncbi:MAG: hypothetical protein IIB58_02505 [Planctomycetes bacterium]|nr:hypothetical protein [Planctomycetota bacterium]